jgi:hypothetical protein
MLSRDPVLQELDRRLVAERGVATTPVVKHFDVVEQVGSGFVPRHKRAHVSLAGPSICTNKLKPPKHTTWQTRLRHGRQTIRYDILSCLERWLTRFVSIATAAKGTLNFREFKPMSDMCSAKQ